MTWLQNPILLAVVIIILIALLVVIRLLRRRKNRLAALKPAEIREVSKFAARNISTLPSELQTTLPVTESSTMGPSSMGVQEEPQAAIPETQNQEDGAPEKIEESSQAEGNTDQIINPDINLLPDIHLNPGDETVLLILPEQVPMEEVKKFEEFLKRREALKIVTTGGSSEEGSNIGIRVLSPINLTEVLSKSHMTIVKYLRKKGTRITLSLRS